MGDRKGILPVKKLGVGISNFVVANYTSRYRHRDPAC